MNNNTVLLVLALIVLFMVFTLMQQQMTLDQQQAQIAENKVRSKKQLVHREIYREPYYDGYWKWWVRPYSTYWSYPMYLPYWRRHYYKRRHFW